MRLHTKNTKAILEYLTSDAIKYNDLHKNDLQKVRGDSTADGRLNLIPEI